MVEHSAVNRRVASSNLARGANFSLFLNYLQTAIFSSFSLWGKLSRKSNGARFPYSRLLVFSTACLTCSLLRHSQLVVTFCFRACVTHGAFDDSVGRHFTQASTEPSEETGSCGECALLVSRLGQLRVFS